MFFKTGDAKRWAGGTTMRKRSIRSKIGGNYAQFPIVAGRYIFTGAYAGGPAPAVMRARRAETERLGARPWSNSSPGKRSSEGAVPRTGPPGPIPGRGPGNR